MSSCVRRALERKRVRVERGNKNKNTTFFSIHISKRTISRMPLDCRLQIYYHGLHNLTWFRSSESGFHLAAAGQKNKKKKTNQPARLGGKIAKGVDVKHAKISYVASAAKIQCTVLQSGRSICFVFLIFQLVVVISNPVMQLLHPIHFPFCVQNGVRHKIFRVC